MVSGKSDNGTGIKGFDNNPCVPPEDISQWNTCHYAMMYHAQGLSVIPIKPHSKEPAIAKWKPYQKEAPSINEIKQWFYNTDNNIGIVTGSVSGGAVVLDFDTEELFREFYSRLDDRLKDIVKNTWIGKTDRGFHVYLRVFEEEMDVPRSRSFGGVDIKGEGGYVVAPPSVHPSGIRYEFLEPDMPVKKVIMYVMPEDWDKIIEIISRITKSDSAKDVNPENGDTTTEPEVNTEKDGSGQKEEPTTQSSPEVTVRKEWRNLTNNQIMKIAELLKPYYRPGLRHGIALYLAGWLYKAGISYESAQTLVKSLCEATNDGECNDRLYTLNDTYGVNRPLREEVLKQEGKSLATKGGLFTWLTEKGGFDEDSVLALIKELEDVLDTPEPNTKVVIELLDYEKETFAVLNFRNCEVYTAYVETNGGERRLVRKSKVILGCPERLVYIAPPYSRIPRLDVTWYIPSQNRRLDLEGVTIDEVLAYLKANGLVINKNLAENVLNAVINAMLRKGLATVKTGYEGAGFYWDKGKLIASKVEVRKPSQEELREALELLNELVTVWFAKVRDQFVTALKLGLVMPFSFAIKQKFSAQKGFIPWLYIYGERDTGKSTTGYVILNVFGVEDNDHVVGHGAVDTEAKLGAKLASDTFPKVVNEGEALFDKPDLVEIIKHSIEGLIARQRFETKSTIREYPALSSLIITANHLRIADPALTQKRLIVLRYPISARQSPERIAEFKAKVSPRLPKLRSLGQFVANYLIEHPEELTYDWLNLSKKILEEAFKYAGVKPAFNLDAQYIDVDEYDPRLDIVLVLWNKVLEAFKRLNLRDKNGNPLDLKEPVDILDLVLDRYAVDFMLRYGDEVLFTSKVLHVLQSENIVVDSMHALAELFAEYGFRYERKKINGRTTRVLSVNFKELVRLFAESFHPQKPQSKPLTGYFN